MKQAISSGQARSLFTYAISKLNPEVFSHPVWIRFGKLGVSNPPVLIGNLLYAAESLEEDDPSGACQVLLICAVCQNSAGRRENGLRATQQALALAERNNLANEMIWAAWGASAICLQEENYEQAAMYLEYLQVALNEQNEWMLADFIEVVKQFMLSPGLARTSERPGLCHDQSHGDLLNLTLDWLRHWGERQPSGPNFAMNAGRSIAHPHPAENNERHAWPGLPLLQSALSSIWSSLSGRITHSLPQRSLVSILPSSTEEPPDEVLSDESRPVARSDEVSGLAAVISTVVQMLGRFSLTIQNAPVKVPASRSLSLLKYLLLHHKQDIPREELMDIFWPDVDPEAARNNLNVAMHSLRQALRSATDVVMIRFEDGAYGLAANLDIWLDVEEFEQCIKEGLRLEAQNQPAAAVTRYEMAVSLYRGDFLADSPYENWTVPERERLLVAYLETLGCISQVYFSQERYAACIAQCQLILARDPCREDTHYRLMQCYSRLGQGALALRQYQICAEALRSELDVDPEPEITQLYEHIRHREPV